MPLHLTASRAASEERGDGKRKLTIKAHGLFVELDPPLVPGLVFITNSPLLEWTGRCKCKGRQGKKAGQRDMRKREKEKREREQEKEREREREKDNSSELLPSSLVQWPETMRSTLLCSFSCFLIAEVSHLVPLVL